MAQYHYDKNGKFIGRSLSEEEHNKELNQNIEMGIFVWKHIILPIGTCLIALFTIPLAELHWWFATLSFIITIVGNLFINYGSAPWGHETELKVSTTTIVRFVIVFGIVLYIPQKNEIDLFSWGYISGAIVAFLGSLDSIHYKK